VIFVFFCFARLCRSTSYLRWHSKASFDRLLISKLATFLPKKCQNQNAFMHVKVIASQKVGRFLRHGVEVTGATSSPPKISNEYDVPADY